MKLQITAAEMQLLQYYGVHNFQQLKEAYANTGDERLVPIITKSMAALFAA